MRFVSVLMAAGSVSALVGCGDSGGSGSGESESAASTEFAIFPKAIFTGFDGAHTYKAPVIAVAPGGDPITAGGITWTLSDPSLGELKVDNAGVTITAKKSGDTTLTATMGTQTATATLKVYAYTEAQWSEGEHRYTNMVDANNPACTNCHGKGAGKGPDHTPTELDADPDDEVEGTFTTGVDPEGRPIAEESEWAYLLEGKMHMWSVTATEKASLMAYLRALEPTGFPEYDAPTDEK